MFTRRRARHEEMRTHRNRQACELLCQVVEKGDRIWAGGRAVDWGTLSKACSPRPLLLSLCPQKDAPFSEHRKGLSHVSIREGGQGVLPEPSLYRFLQHEILKPHHAALGGSVRKAVTAPLNSYSTDT